ncbi:hypothetical protein EW093_01085 [Thiospirochaeta perfilievii]|uniref:Transposase domain-containing protein n=1 Tax=Thiospirochaeta perfilievii TaxID=252967 RepID=A0A5C1Q5W1_9SPIO|nr:hypothetical protein EW093_01085 [Thiospirochaeta perfilievii]
MNNLSVIDYFNYILRKIPYCEIKEDYQKLLPFNLSAEELKAV